MKRRNNSINVALLSSVVVALVVVIAILYTVATEGTPQTTPEKQYYEVVEDTQPTVVETLQTDSDQQQTDSPIDTETQAVYTEDGVVSISNSNNDIYIEGSGNINVQIDGSVVVSGDSEDDETDNVAVSQDGNSNVNIGNVGNGAGEIVINNN